MPNMSNTSRSNQSADLCTLVIEGSISSSRTATRRRMRWFWYIDRKW